MENDKTLENADLAPIALIRDDVFDFNLAAKPQHQTKMADASDLTICEEGTLAISEGLEAAFRIGFGIAAKAARLGLNELELHHEFGGEKQALLRFYSKNLVEDGCVYAVTVQLGNCESQEDTHPQRLTVSIARNGVRDPWMIDAQSEAEAYIAGANVALQFEREGLRAGQALETPQELVPDELRFRHPQSGQVVGVFLEHVPL